jgi:adenylate kinase family enzyme
MPYGAQKIAVISSASGNGKTTLGRELAHRLDLPFVELDALVHGPNWAETPDELLRALVQPIVASESWVIDGTYQRKLGRLVLDGADLIVWLDLPIRVWLLRLVRRTWRRLRGQEPLWNDNRESVASAILGWDSLFVFALRTHFARRREWPRELAGYPLIRLRAPAAVRKFVNGVGEGRLADAGAERPHSVNRRPRWGRDVELE